MLFHSTRIALIAWIVAFPIWLLLAVATGESDLRAAFDLFGWLVAPWFVVLVTLLLVRAITRPRPGHRRSRRRGASRDAR